MTMKANMGKLVLGLVLILAGMGVAYLAWNMLLGTEIIYLPSRLRGGSQTVPLLCSLPGAVVFLIWFFGRKSYVENVQKIDDGAFKFGLFLMLAICADLAVGVIGLVVIGFQYIISAGIVAYAVSVGLQVVFCLLAFVLCPPYSRH